MDTTEQLLKELTEAYGVPGYENEIRSIMRERLSGVGLIEQDKLGSLIARLPGPDAGPRVLLAAHMDEIGFLVRHITDDGFLKFVPLGGWWDQVMLAQRVIIRTHKGDVTGVFGAKAPHLMNAEERRKVFEKKSMYIDIGATSADEVREAGVRIGDPVFPVSPFTILSNPKTYLAKAFDDRVGCAVMIQVMEALAKDDENQRVNTLYGAATVMEEVGTRGAKTSAHVVSPDVAIVLESDIAGDVPGISKDECPNQLGKGPSMLLYDARQIPNIPLRDLAIATAEELEIPLQLNAMEGGATDGGPIHMHNEGVPTIVIAIPARHIHSHTSIIHRDDYDRAVTLVTALVRKLDGDTVAGLTG